MATPRGKADSKAHDAQDAPRRSGRSHDSVGAKRSRSRRSTAHAGDGDPHTPPSDPSAVVSGDWLFPDIVRLYVANRQWARSYRLGGRRVQKYFGSVARPQAEVLAEWRARHPRYAKGLDDGEGARVVTADPTLLELATDYLAWKERAADRGETTRGNFANHRLYARTAVRAIGPRRRLSALEPADFDTLLELCDDRSPSYRDHLTVTVRELLAFGADQRGTLRVTPPKHFARSSQRAKRQHARRNPTPSYTAADVHRLLAAARPRERAWILLAVNGGYEASQIGALRRSSVDLTPGAQVIVQRREKTLADRVVPLWPETARALEEAMDPPRPPGGGDEDRLAFTNRLGNPVSYETPGGKRTCSVLRAFATVRAKAGLGGGFYTLRRFFRTAADALADERYTNLVMGHAQKGIGDLYVLEHDYDRVLKVTDHVRRRLFQVDQRDERGAWSGVVSPDAVAALEATSAAARLGRRR